MSLKGAPSKAWSVVLLSVVLPGGGQAYLGRLGRALMFMVFSPLIFPWILGCLDAHQLAIVCAHRSRSRGFVGLAIHACMTLNTALFIAIVLTLTGVVA